VDTEVNIDERNFRSMPRRFASRDRRWQRQSVHRVALVIAVSSFWAAGLVSATQQSQESSSSFQVPHSDLANAEALGNQLAGLSPRVDRTEAKALADCAYATVSQLRRQYRMFGTPIFNNFLIYHGLKKRGYCYQWSEDLLVALDPLKLKSLELHWGEANPGNWRENNCLVVTAKGQPFNHGIVLDCWKHFGHLHWNPVLSDEEPYVENRAYARFVLSRSAARNASGPNHRVAFQSRAEASGKTGD
jgi:hypothetical protein